jgi:tyrosine-protein phosphatase SIW14
MNSARTFILLCALIFSGCATHARPTVHGIDNFGEVAPGIYRGGQPNAAGWYFLKTLGVTNVVKLNPDEEGSDPARAFNVQSFPVTLAQQLGLPGAKLERTVNGAVNAIQPGTFIHCTHGQDRTGLVVGEYRRRVCGWSKSAARQEMHAYGFHPELIGLELFWEIER